MSGGQHHRQTYVEGVHSIVAYVYANQAAREAATGFISDDLWKVARQSDNETFWVLTATTPTWQQLGSGAGGGGDQDATYLTLSLTSSLTRERVLTVSGTTGLLMLDNGPNTAVTMSINNNIVATLSGSTFSGPINASAAGVTGSLTGSVIGTLSGSVKGPSLSGSLTRLESGEPYLFSQGNITLTTTSLGQIIISSSFSGQVGPQGPSGSNVWADGGDRLKTTGSVSVSGGENVYANEKGTDVFFYVSGTTDITSSLAKKAVMGGDTHFSGSMFIKKNASFNYVDMGNKGPGSTVFDFRLGQKFRGVLTASFTASIIDPPGACNLIVKLIQDSTGNHTIKLPSNFKILSGSSTVLLTSNSGAQDLWSIYCDGEFPSASYYLMNALKFVSIP